MKLSQTKSSWSDPEPQAEDGVFEFPAIAQGDPPFPLVAAREDTGPIVAELLKQSAGKQVIAYREQLPLSRFLELWGDATGKEVRTKKPEALPVFPELAREIDETFKFANEFGYWGHEDTSVLTPEQVGSRPN